VRHSPEGPPLLPGVSRASSRRSPARRASNHRSGRLALGVCLSTVVTSLVLAMPVMAGSGSTTPVVLGQDGGPLSSETFAGLSSAATFSSATGEASAAASATSERETPEPSAAVAAPSTPVAPAPTTAAPVAPEPQPVPEPEVQPEQEPEPAPAPKAAPAPAPAVAAPSDGSTEGQVLALVNAERAAAGCGALSADGGLASVARAHSEDMRDRGYFDHVNLDGLDPFDRADRAGVSARAENIAWGQRDAAEVMESWMTSAGHRANILNCSLTRLGVGVAQGSGGPWWTQLFG
jgi:uncharacterized protein YkwD